MTSPIPKETKKDELQEEYVPTVVLDRFDKIESTQSTLSTKIKFIQDTNNLVVIVLFVGFLIMLLTIVGMFIGSMNDASKSTEDLNKSVQELNAKISSQSTNR